ncbi:MAG TPA: hypothetical protein DEG70_07325, partial [Chloroflexi bacterium]|nr:hypothetical protein [Chloroflexota bacterium]
AGTSDGLLSTASDPEGSTLSIVSAEPYGGSAFGSLVWQSDGSFTWDPPAGAKYTAGTWQITVTDTAGHETTGLVTFELVNRRVLFVDNAASGSEESGRWDAPYTSLSQAVAASVIGDAFYLAAGSGAYVGTVTLKPGQTLIGAGATGASFLALLGGDPPVRGAQDMPSIGGASPVITTTNGPGLVLSSGNTIDGVTIGATRGTAIVGSGSGGAGPTVRNVSISGSGGPALDIIGFAGGTMTFLGIERTANQTTSSPAVIHLSDLPGSVIVVEGSLQLTTSVMRGLQTKGVGSFEARGGVSISSGAYQGIYSESSTIRLSGAAEKIFITNGDAGISVRKQSSFVVAGGQLRITTVGANALDVALSSLEIAGAGNVIETTGGIGIWLYQATIGPAGVAFDAVSASGATNGVHLETVESQGPLVIGPDDSEAAFGAGGTIVGTSGPGVMLSFVNNVTLRHVVVGAAGAAAGEPASTANTIDGAGIDASVSYTHL